MTKLCDITDSNTLAELRENSGEPSYPVEPEYEPINGSYADLVVMGALNKTFELNPEAAKEARDEHMKKLDTQLMLLDKQLRRL